MKRETACSVFARGRSTHSDHVDSFPVDWLPLKYCHHQTKAKNILYFCTFKLDDATLEPTLHSPTCHDRPCPCVISAGTWLAISVCGLQPGLVRSDGWQWAVRKEIIAAIILTSRHYPLGSTGWDFAAEQQNTNTFIKVTDYRVKSLWTHLDK